ncbi:universal stress protein [Marinococcus halophilus]|uniref:Universal stress protein UspA n=1 Tax=Marinococcus halophilus TaxID=1371 RepID=A0A510Y9H1_MARHA|nr:universal stress protein [Marinococcus halophilus]OZT79907.1 universal stress protein [Marinococcus halophilus]GEK60036.1 universal stress protein UspA [Marinococcus halophilus]
MSRYERILVGLDVLETPSYDAFEEACAMALEHRASLILAFVFDEHRYANLKRIDPRAVRYLKEKADYHLEAYKEKAMRRGVTNVQTVVDAGVPEKRLARHLCLTHNVDLILVGETGGPSFERIIRGRRSRTVASKASCEVRVVRNSRLASLNAYPRVE